MAKTSAIQRNLKRIRMTKRFENKRKKLKVIINNKKLPLNERFAAQLKLSKLPKNSARTRIRNRCEITGRPHGVYRKLRISRIALRQMASAGKIPGMTKSSWYRRNMTLVDPIGDMLTRIRNGQMRSLTKIVIPFSNFRLKILEVLKKEGYIINFNISDDKNKIKSILVDLKYYEGQPVIKEIKRISKPGRRVYSRADSIPRVLNGLGLAILSTSKGVMSDTEAVKNNLGGEIICRIF